MIFFFLTLLQIEESGKIAQLWFEAEIIELDEGYGFSLDDIPVKIQQKNEEYFCLKFGDYYTLQIKGYIKNPYLIRIIISDLNHDGFNDILIESFPGGASGLAARIVIGQVIIMNSEEVLANFTISSFDGCFENFSREDGETYFLCKRIFSHMDKSFFQIRTFLLTENGFVPKEDTILYNEEGLEIPNSFKPICNANVTWGCP